VWGEAAQRTSVVPARAPCDELPSRRLRCTLARTLGREPPHKPARPYLVRYPVSTIEGTHRPPDQDHFFHRSHLPAECPLSSRLAWLFARS
jgi:hypothetical protein